MTVVEGDVTAKETMEVAMSDVDGVFHVAGWTYVGVGPREVETAERVNIDGTRNILELMEELNVPKGVYTSSVVIYGSSGGDPIDESYRYDGPHKTVYGRTKWQAHYDVAKPMMADGLPLVTVQPGAAYGPWDKPSGSWRGVFRDYLQGDLPMVPRRFNFPFEYAADTAHSHVLAMERGDPGEEYIVANESYTLVEVFDLAEELTGVPTPRAAPNTVFGVLARIMAGAEHVVAPPDGLEAEALRLFANTDLDVDNSKAKRELGVEHRPFEEGLRDYLEWEMEQ